MLRIFIAVVGVITASCTTEEPVDPNAPAAPFQDHIVMFNGAGEPIDPLGNAWPSLFPYRVMGDDEFQHHVDDVFDAIANNFEHEGVKDLFVFVHGGLNTQAGSVERAQTLLPLMMKDGYYPIFINWQSSLVSSYFEHLLFVRQGRDEGWSGAIWAPFVLLSDLARTVARAPLGLGRMANSMWTSLPFAWTGDQAVATSTASAALSEFGKGSTPASETVRAKPIEPNPEVAPTAVDAALELETFPIKVGNDGRGTGEQLWSMTKWVVTSPIKIVTGLFVQGFGTPAWEMMLRRTHLLFAEEDRYLEGGIGARNARQPEADDGTTEAGVVTSGPPDAARLSRLFDEAVKRRDKWTREKESENAAGADAAPPRTTKPHIIACGHSMGAIVLNELVRRDTRRLLRHAMILNSRADATTNKMICELVERGVIKEPVVTPLFDDLIYLAPACSVADFVDTVTPYLELAKSTRVHVLVLHSRAEVNESNAFELAPRGSLIDWIDTLLSNPTDTRERRLGAFTNLMLSLHEFPPSVRGRIQIHSFGYAGPERDREPEKHCEFVDLGTARWWQRSFWEVWPRRIDNEADLRRVEHSPDDAKQEAEQKSKD